MEIKSGFYKKSQDINLLFVAVILLVIAITAVVGFKAVKQLNSAVQNMDATDEVKNITQKVEDRYVVIWDALFLFFLVFSFIVLIASAFFIDTHPIFFIITLFVVVITAFVGGHLANAYSSFEENQGIVAEASAFKIIPYIFQHYVAIIVIMGMATLTVLFAKIKSSSG